LEKNLNEEDLTQEEMTKLKKYFAPLYELGKADKKDAHLSGDNNRLPNLLINAYADVQDQKSYGCGIPSPLYILYQMLTVPEEPQSAAYALLFCRTLLYELFKVFPEHPLLHDTFKSFNIRDINKIRDIFANSAKKGDNISPATDPVKLMLAHFIAMKGIFYFRFSDRTAAEKYLDGGELSDAAPIKMGFHKLSYYDMFPDASLLMNELSGIPLPIKGADTIFQGGLKTDSKSNLIIRVSGDAGTGKTSLALALSAALSPYGTQVFYLSLEEKEDDLRNRLLSLFPTSLTGLSFYKENKSWFHPIEIPLYNIDASERFELFDKAIDEIRETLEKDEPNESTDKLNESKKMLPSVCPLVIVIDSIRSFIKEGANLEKFIESCRALNAIVVLISSNSETFHHDIDYMVDVVINLKYSGTQTQKEKPERILQLLKTRYQSSRPGAHVFHTSGNGLYISPQLPSQIDRVEFLSRPLPSYEYYINFFKENAQCNTKLVLWDKSQILLHGYGSSGKAGLALSLLMYPLKKQQKDSPDPSDPDIHKKRKTLVVSLLYPQKYYEGLIKKLVNSNKEKFQNSSLECLCFYSGYLTPEDFISKILTKLDAAILEGEPFTGILLDGLHNAILQFPKLQADDMVWSTLYSLLAKYFLTIVTTYTNFKIEDGIDKKGILLKEDKLLLDLIIQVADYYLSVDKTENLADGRYSIILKSAIRHRIKHAGEDFFWNREGLSLNRGEKTTQQQLFDHKSFQE
jgi:KaiC/GvpD/RAD55 family RecA-like ATPase